MSGPHIPDPFYVDIVKAVSALESKVENIGQQLHTKLDTLVQTAQHDTLRREVSLQRWVLGGFFVMLMTLAGWIIGIKS